MIVSYWTIFLVGVVKHDWHSCLGYTSLALFVHQLLETVCTDLQSAILNMFLLLFVRLSKHDVTTKQTAHTCCKFCMPRTKQIESKMLDFPLPFNPVMALNWGSNPGISTRCAYDLKPSKLISFTYMVSSVAVVITGSWLPLVTISPAIRKIFLYQKLNCFFLPLDRVSEILIAFWLPWTLGPGTVTVAQQAQQACGAHR